MPIIRGAGGFRLRASGQGRDGARWNSNVGNPTFRPAATSLASSSYWSAGRVWRLTLISRFARRMRLKMLV